MLRPAEKPTASPPAAARPLTWHYWPARGEAAPQASLKGGLGPAGNFADNSLVVLGLGAVGGVALGQAARLGIGSLWGADPDQYEDDSWRTQPSEQRHAGQAKAWVQGACAHAINHGVNVHTLCGQAQDLPLAVLRKARVLLAAGDNLELLVWAGGLAAALGKPLVQGAVHPETWSAIVRGYDLDDPEAACPACALSDSDWGNLRTRHGCDPQSRSLPGTEPTRALPFLCAAAAQLLVGEAAKWLCGRCDLALRGEELDYCLLTHKSWRTQLPRVAGCRLPHRRWNQLDVPLPPSQETLAGLARRLDAIPAGASAELLQVRGETPWCSFALCACGAETPVRRFAKLGQKVGRCRCGAALVAGPVGLRSTLPAADLAACRERSLQELGVADEGAVGMSLGDEGTWFFLSSGASGDEEH